MKRILLLFLVALLPLVASADTVEIDGIIYNLILKAKIAEVVGISNNYNGTLNIPESVTYEGNRCSVTSIKNSAFSGCSGLYAISIPNSVTSIGIYAFYGCTGLTSITIPNNVTTIGEYAFSNCSSLFSVSIGNGVTSIGNHAFYECRNLKKVIVPDMAAWCGISFGSSDANPLSMAHHLFSDSETEITDLVIPNGVSSIGNYTFYCCYGLISATIPYNMKSIGDGTFYGCSGLKSIIIPNSLTKIGRNAFTDCTSLTSINIPNSITTISDYLFAGCIGLNSITIPNNVKTIGNGAFSCCSGLTSITILGNVTKIGDDAFNSCANLTSVNIPNSVASIGNYAFSGCSTLTSISIGSGVTSIGSYTFAHCPELLDVYCFATNAPNTSSNAFEGSYIDYATLHVPSIGPYKNKSPWKSFGSIVQLGNDNYIEGIYYNFYDDFAEVTNGIIEYSGGVVIPNNVTFKGKNYIVTKIGKSAFANCSGLTSITIPNSVTYIDNFAFYGCTSMEKVIISDIAAWCGISFAGYEANPLSKAHHLYLNNSTEIKELVIPNGVTIIKNNAFRECSGLTGVTIPESVTEIGDNAFDRCSGLTSITIPDNVTSIGYATFWGCSGLTSIKIPSSLTSIGECAFENCKSLSQVIVSDIAAWCSISFNGYESNPLSKAHHLFINNSTEIKKLVIPNGVTSISNYAFRDCKGLEEVIIPHGVTDIGDYTFDSCTGLTKVIIPNSVTSIGFATFWGCSGLTSFRIPDSAKSIGGCAFENCNGMTSLIIPCSVTNIGSSAFNGCSSLIDVYCLAEIIPQTKSLSFDNSSIKYATLYVLSSALEQYMSTAPWSGFGTITALTEDEIDGIKPIENEQWTADNSRQSIYDLSGRKLDKPQKGINIIRYSDGTSRKVLVK